MSPRVTRPMQTFDAVPERVVDAAKRAFSKRAPDGEAVWAVRQGMEHERPNLPTVGR